MTDNERQMLGSILLDPQMMLRVQDEAGVRPEHLTPEALSVWGAAKTLIRDLGDDGPLPAGELVKMIPDRINEPVVFVARMFTAVSGGVNAVVYARAVVDDWLARQAARIVESLVQPNSRTVREEIGRVLVALRDVSDEGGRQRPLHIGEVPSRSQDPLHHHLEEEKKQDKTPSRTQDYNNQFINFISLQSDPLLPVFYIHNSSAALSSLLSG